MHATAAKISAALIVRNEEHCLERCLRSLQGAVDEIVVVDTGSTDRTQEIARQFTSRVFEFPWRKDFAAARQYSFDRAQGDWVCWVDADDVLVNPDQIRSNVTQAAPEVRGFYWKYVVGRDQYGHSTCELWRERCVRNDGCFRWMGRVHEVLVPAFPVCMLWDESVGLVHAPPASRVRDPNRNLEILEEQYRQGQGSRDARLLLYLGNEHADRAQFDLALSFLQQYLALSEWDDEKYLALMKVAGLFRLLGRYEDAIDSAVQGLKIHPDWPNAQISLAESYYYLHDWEKVIYWVESGRRLAPPKTLCVVHPLEYTYSWIIHYTNALFHVGRKREALTWTERALEICPQDAWHRANREFFRTVV